MEYTKEAYERAVAWRDAAKADGWTCTPTYGDHEGEDRACTLVRQGFKASIMTRTPPPKTARGQTKHEGSVDVWFSDGLAVKVPHPYGWDKLVAGTRTCLECGTTDVCTKRVGLAGRVCDTCLPSARKKYEFPGWCD